jgi:para-aminobenzoate synthetase/4-amino-4-deoxychorismate lyase
MRSLYNNAFEKAQADGLFDFLFLNEQGEVTEGCITNIIIYAAGQYATPPVSCGLLSGIMRGVLLADKAVPVFEKVLTEQDVRGADAVFLCNSVRGVIRVRMR